mmetsp:Transcript_37263/g.82893  ORF Transcript_37263/g.82893 Transcript_37263/m.82893 type:complete len:1238 (-) Transcript_37263:319-4032(-)|eukprot:CAMPEP_0202896518 /NCGR_PEP_ID=MMETSP1392-20130828/5510_1 /ASSEMBLY_ACC=CAM_ASM_000868 /TAXON_ID=225041 /ORGANISM="Chlamydomonas chlamydogama, Strain SAG 11-48b" /LENGTH=1237 /DNA_ID=CAMNT_0049581905 /DNA_START=264 /DNA_END=3977 /DNA_ORIENTATION=+
MGNAAAVPRQGGVPSLDELGGYYRPAVKRKDELNTKMDWLGKAVLDQADKMEKVLDKRADKDRDLHALGGPRADSARSSFAFGGFYKVQSRLPSTTASHKSATGSQRSLVSQSSRFRSTSAPSSSKSITVSPSMGTSGRFSQRPATAELTTRRPGTTDQLLRPSTAAASRTTQPSQGGRPSTATVGSGRSRASMSRGGLSSSVDTAWGMAGRSSVNFSASGSIKSTNSAAGRLNQSKLKSNALIQQQQQLQQEAQLHWRERVARAKRRLYLYLRGYMALVSILKRKRRGYADHLTVELLPVFMTNALGDSAYKFGEHLMNCGGLVELGPQTRSKLTALKGGRLWLQRAKIKKEVLESDGTGEEAAASPPSEPISVPTPPATSPKGKRLATARIRTRAAARVSSSENSMLTVQAAVLDKSRAELTATVRQKSIRRRVSDAGSKYTAEIEVLRQLTAAYLSRGPPIVKVIGRKEKADVDNMVKGEQLNLQILANRANAKWVEAQLPYAAGGAGGKGWFPPTVLDPKMLQAGGVDIDMYKKVGPELLREGKLAFQLIYLGEEQVTVADDAGAEGTEPLIKSDLWSIIAKVFPHKVPAGNRIVGLTMLDRRMLQLICEVEKLSGKHALDRLTVLLCVDSVSTAWVSEQMRHRQHWGLKPEQIYVVSIARFPGLMWENQTKTFMVTYNHQFPYLPAGSGFAMLSLGWASTAFTVTAEGSRYYVAGSVLQMLSKLKVEYIHSSMMCDTEMLSPANPLMEPTFMGPAIYGMDVKGAGMAMQAMHGKNDSLTRQHNSLILSPDPGQPFSCSIPFLDLQTPATRPLLIAAVKQANVWSCTNRYLFQLSYLMDMMTGPNSFHPDIEVITPCAYVSLDMADLTSTGPKLGRCIAVAGRVRGPDPKTKVCSKEWLRDYGSYLITQDNQPSFRGRVAALSSAVNNPPPTTITTTEMGASAKSARVLLFVKDNHSSKLAFRLACMLLRQPGDSLTLVHVTTARTPVEVAKELVESFVNLSAEHMIRRRVVVQVDKLAETLIAEVETLRPDLVVMGSEVLGSAGGALASSTIRYGKDSLPLSHLGGSTSICMAVAKAALDVPLLVVKANSAGELFTAPDDPSVLTAIKAMVEVQTSSLPMLSWLCSRLTSTRDKMLLVRPHGLEPDGRESVQTQRMMTTFANEAVAHGFGTGKRAMMEGAEGLPSLVQQDKVDLLAILAPNARVTPPQILEVLKHAKTNVLVWRPSRTADIL